MMDPYATRCKNFGTLSLLDDRGASRPGGPPVCRIRPNGPRLQRPAQKCPENAYLRILRGSVDIQVPQQGSATWVFALRQ